jgi:hypothetical protein
MKRKANPTLIGTALRLWPAVTGLTAIVRMAEIVAGAVDVPVGVDAIAGAAGAADVLVAADVIVDAVARAGEDIRSFATEMRKGPRRKSWPFRYC